MNRVTVTSSNVVSVGYDPSTMTLEVEFTDGPIYQYFDVPEMEYQNLMTSDSIGGYLNRNIKGSFRYVRL
jgi:hypothetical protein